MGLTKMNEWARIRHNSQLDIELLHAHYVQHAYPRHSHDYYVISVIEKGNQSFTHKGIKHTTPPGGVILINPGDAHTGEAADSQGFELRSLYPTVPHMEAAIYELTGHHHRPPFFSEVQVNSSWLSRNIVSLHKMLFNDADSLESESRFISLLTHLVKQYTASPITEQKLGSEKTTIAKARQYIDENFDQGVSLRALAQYVSLSPFYLLRAFSAEMGMPPYAYLESVRIQHTQRLIELGKPLAEIAVEVGFSSQSQMTGAFKKIIGVTPGKYAREFDIHK
jgi:AraC-like DNA-binding protein